MLITKDKAAVPNAVTATGHDVRCASEYHSALISIYVVAVLVSTKMASAPSSTRRTASPDEAWCGVNTVTAFALGETLTQCGSVHRRPSGAPTQRAISTSAEVSRSKVGQMCSSGPWLCSSGPWRPSPGWCQHRARDV